MAENAEWSWQDALAEPLSCVSQLPTEYDFEINTVSGDRLRFDFTLVKDGKNLFTWPGHRFTVFSVAGNQLYSADWNPNGSGGEIVQVSLDTGNEVWRTPLQALGPIQHSAYSNRLTLAVNDDVVSEFGLESSGRYFEIKDINTGDTVGHKIFLRDEGAAKS